MKLHPRGTDDEGHGSSAAGRSLPGSQVDGIFDGDAVEQLVRTHQTPLRSFLRYLGCPASLVDDLLQETFLAFFSKPFEVRDDHSTARFLRSIARHKFLKALRRLDREPPTLDFDAAETAWAELREETGGQPYMEALRHCLAAVRGRAKEALSLRYTGNLGRAAIASQMELTESGVHSILVRVRRRLRECVEARVEG